MTISFPAEVSTFLQLPHVACLATINPDGTPHLTYVWYEYSGNNFLISTVDDWVKTKNLQRDPRAVLSILDRDNPRRWVRISGPATVSRRDANDLIMRVSIHYLGEEEGRPYAERLQGPERVVLNLVPTSLVTRDFPGSSAL